jgi:hypothetical protein
MLVLRAGSCVAMEHNPPRDRFSVFVEREIAHGSYLMDGKPVTALVLSECPHETGRQARPGSLSPSDGASFCFASTRFL